MKNSSLTLTKDGLISAPSADDFLCQWLEKTAPPEIANPKEYIQFREDNPKQIELFKAIGVWDWYNGGELQPAVAPVIGYGGAAFGGKTYGILIAAALLSIAYPGAQMGYFRRTYSELSGPDGAMTKAGGIFSGIAKPRGGAPSSRAPRGTAHPAGKVNLAIVVIPQVLPNDVDVSVNVYGQVGVPLFGKGSDVVVDLHHGTPCRIYVWVVTSGTDVAVVV